MNKRDTLEYLRRVRSGEVTPEDALMRLCMEPFEDLGYAKLDRHRELRQGIAEVIYGESKTPEQISGIVTAMREGGQSTILITRLSPEAASRLDVGLEVNYNETARIGIVGAVPSPDGIGRIVVATGGTSDLPVAEEAALTAEVFGNDVLRLYDVGVAGIHRLFSSIDAVMDAQVVIDVAGMEGALASVLGGLTDCPVIGVPTSVGYGASFGGIAALLSMLNSCASGVCAVNIDNGFGAGYLASVINHQRR